MGRHSRRRSNLAQRPQLRLPDRDRLHSALGDAHRAHLADHRHRSRDQFWGSPWIAHPIVSFQFADAPPLCFSIEIRKKLGQTYSTIGGLYRQYELIYIVADERDVIRLRTNYRKEDVYLYRTTISPAHARERFLEYIHSLNALRNKPRWYNAITTNCTTSIRTQHPRQRACAMGLAHPAQWQRRRTVV